MQRPLAALGAAVLVLSLSVTAAGGAQLADYSGRAFNVLPPGESGAVPPVRTSTDQLRLYDALTPRGGRVAPGDLSRYFKSAKFGTPTMAGRVERTPRRGLRIVRDRYDVPHVFGATRYDVEYGAGWVTAHDRSLLIELARGPARLAALDVPGVDPLGVALELRQFRPSAQTEQFIAAQAGVLRRLGPRGRQTLRDIDAYVAGINAYYRSVKSSNVPWTRNDVLAFNSLVGALFGKGGGGEVASSALLAALQARLGPVAGHAAWNDLHEINDPEAPVTVPGTFPLNPAPTGPTPGSAVIDPTTATATPGQGGTIRPPGPPSMSNALLVGAKRSATGRPIAVMGPQVGYFYPQFLMELDLHGGGIDARGAAFPGISFYVLLGRGADFSWSATSPGTDNVDTFLDELCNADGSPATSASQGYRFDGTCRPLGTFDAGTLTGAGGGPAEPVVFRTTVHGPVESIVTVAGRPFAVTKQRSTRGREPASAVAFQALNENAVHSAREFNRTMRGVEFTFNWFYADDRDIALYSSGRVPIKAPGTDPRLPTLGTGQYEWRGFVAGAAHPQAIDPAGDAIVNWNNQPARGWAAADDNYTYGPVHRVDSFRLPAKGKIKLNTLVGVMNRAATADLRAEQVWPDVAAVLAGGAAPDARTQAAAALVTSWARGGASRIDRTQDGTVDAAGAAVLDAAWAPIVRAVFEPTLGTAALDAFQAAQPFDDPPSPTGSAYLAGAYGQVDKDLRTVLGRPVRGPYSRTYCGGGDLAACRASLWAALKTAADGLAAAQGPDPSRWRADAAAERIRFAPGLLGPAGTMRWTNRPTFQQVIEFTGHRPR